MKSSWNNNPNPKMEERFLKFVHTVLIVHLFVAEITSEFTPVSKYLILSVYFFHFTLVIGFKSNRQRIFFMYLNNILSL